ncbi:MAG: FtsP/CotA-like multicopper oxidase with cupredoxin domain [Bacteriovoracaceae bacterium]|jgi:FtsP/CotA-like multicopper oxidase with cupredoxin domain
MQFKSVSTFVLLFLMSLSSFAAERHYELRVHHTTKNITGVDVDHALAINESIPAPTLRFNLGDDAVIKVINETSEPTTLHWHGLLVPWEQDGPQFSNTKIIEPNTTHTFRFPIRHTGTYWYHSHTELQEQRGLYGAIVIEEDQPLVEVDHDFVYVMSDWTNEIPKAVLYNLKKDGDYYGMKKGFLPNLWDAIKLGKFKEFFKQDWTRMGAMDLSDVGYDAFLINGKIKSMLKDVRHGEKVRFRIINASASTYFYFNIGKNRNFKVITKDGMPVQPVEVNELQVAIAETYDVIFEVPHMMKTFEAKATAQDITGSASLMFGMGEMEMVPMKMKPSPYGMDMDMDHGGGHGGGHDDGGSDDGDDDDWDDDDMGSDHTGHDMGNMSTMDMGDGDHDMPMPMPGKTKKLKYEMLKSVEPSKIDDNLIRAKVIDLELSGDMERYTWHINGKPFSEDKYINIRENEVITFRYINKTMMHHPMHLHGHFFRVLNGQGDYAPLMHTVDVAPMKTVTIEFHANEPGIWFLHCHNMYHMKMGMARLVKYIGIEPTQELKDDQAKWGPKMTHDDDAFWRAETSLYSNTAKVDVAMNKGAYEVEMELEVDEYDIDNFEAEAMFKKYLNRFTSVGTGVVVEDQKVYAALTAAYTLKGNIEMQGYIRHDGKAVVKLKKTIPLAVIANRPLILDLSPEFGYKDQFDWNFESEVSYKYSERVSFGVNFRTDDKGDDSVGFGIKIRF